MILLILNLQTRRVYNCTFLYSPPDTPVWSRVKKGGEEGCPRAFLQDILCYFLCMSAHRFSLFLMSVLLWQTARFSNSSAAKTFQSWGRISSRVPVSEKKWLFSHWVSLFSVHKRSLHLRQTTEKGHFSLSKHSDLTVFLSVLLGTFEQLLYMYPTSPTVHVPVSVWFSNVNRATWSKMPASAQVLLCPSVCGLFRNSHSTFTDWILAWVGGWLGRISKLFNIDYCECKPNKYIYLTKYLKCLWVLKGS